MKTPRDTENYLVRLRAAGPNIDEAIAIMGDRAKQNIRLHGFLSFSTLEELNHLGVGFVSLTEAAEIRKLYRAGISKAEIARHLQIGRTSLRRILDTTR